jgi:hypothetical protein
VTPKPKRPIGRPRRTRFPELPSFYKDKRNLVGQELLNYEAARSRIVAQEEAITERS